MFLWAAEEGTWSGEEGGSVVRWSSGGTEEAADGLVPERFAVPHEDKGELPWGRRTAQMGSRDSARLAWGASRDTLTERRVFPLPRGPEKLAAE